MLLLQTVDSGSYAVSFTDAAACLHAIITTSSMDSNCWLIACIKYTDFNEINTIEAEKLFKKSS